jgi:hypothetical protein
MLTVPRDSRRATQMLLTTPQTTIRSGNIAKRRSPGIRMSRVLLPLACCILATGSLGVCADPTPTGLSCITEMLLPSYGAIARRAAEQGTVISQINIGLNGKLASIHSTAPDAFLVREVETFLRYNTSFNTACSGQALTLKFTFVLNKVPPTPSPGLNVKFRGPNEFVIESSPQAPIPDVIRREDH